MGSKRLKLYKPIMVHVNLLTENNRNVSHKIARPLQPCCSECAVLAPSRRVFRRPRRQYYWLWTWIQGARAPFRIIYYFIPFILNGITGKPKRDVKGAMHGIWTICVHVYCKLLMLCCIDFVINAIRMYCRGECFVYCFMVQRKIHFCCNVVSLPFLPFIAFF